MKLLIIVSKIEIINAENTHNFLEEDFLQTVKEDVYNNEMINSYTKAAEIAVMVKAIT